MIDVVSLYFELVSLSPEQRQQRLSKLELQFPAQVSELRSMLALGEETQHGSKLLAQQLSSAQATNYQDYIGQVVMGFTITEILSEAGGMGLVFLAQQRLCAPDSDEVKTHRAAIKVLRAEILNPTQQQQFFYREAASLMTLDHPNICKIYGVSQVLDQACIVMDYIDGMSLDRWFQQNQITESQALDKFEKLLNAMSYAHNKHVYHGDLKPQNVLLNTDEQLTLIDMGLAKQFETQTEDDFSQHYIHAFSKHWSAPEQLAGKWNKSQSDVYSLGAILCFLLTGSAPIAGDLTAINNKELRAIVSKATQTLAQDRYRDANALLEALNLYRGGYALSEYSNRWSYRARKALQRRPLVSLSIALIASLILGSSITTWRHNQVLLAEQLSNQQVMAQLEKTLRDNFPVLSYRFEQPSVEQLYVQGAEHWLASHHTLTESAKRQTGLLFIQGLFAQYSENVEQILAILEVLGVDTRLKPNDTQQLQLQSYWMLAHAFNAFKGIDKDYGESDHSFYDYRRDPTLIPDNNPAAKLARSLIAQFTASEPINPEQIKALISAFKVPMPFDKVIRKSQYLALFEQVKPYISQASLYSITQRLDLLEFIYLGGPQSSFFDQSADVNDLARNSKLRQHMQTIEPELLAMLSSPELSVADFYRLHNALLAINPSLNETAIRALISTRLQTQLDGFQLSNSAKIQQLADLKISGEALDSGAEKERLRDELRLFRRRYGSTYGDMMTHLTLLQGQALALGNAKIFEYFDSYMQSQAMRMRRLDYRYDSAYQGLDLAIIRQDWTQVVSRLSNLETDFEVYFSLLESEGLQAFEMRKLHLNAWIPASQNNWQAVQQQVAQSQLNVQEQQVYLAFINLSFERHSQALAYLNQLDDLPLILESEFDNGFYLLNELAYFFGKNGEPERAIVLLNRHADLHADYANIFHAVQALYLADLYFISGNRSAAESLISNLQQYGKSFSYRSDWEKLWRDLAQKFL
ncbi:serine/threonine protein kinase [Alginatibacterium sediminis]|uniref:Serine/threonine protein kinase n=1 Tax=Alginatibacterium sediminis TaxID=2164068 RepID=A0A420E6H1_9ALTE|nr:serine/threonine-protein kinase [Alginatibacterium sediminis]RKF13681.1 serine/threonine protein kinase [Alginatibacterium sediminis]